MTEAATVLERSRRRELPSPALRRAIRVDAGLTQEDVAEVLGVSAAAVSHWEKGERLPRLRHRERYADLLRALQTREDAA